jgi:hypothetical protein
VRARSAVQGDSGPRPGRVRRGTHAMTNRPKVVQACPEGPAARASELRVYRLGDYGLIDLVGAPPDGQQLRRALLWEWSTSAAGVIVRINSDTSPDDMTVQAIAIDAAALVRTWPGTPVGFVIERSGTRSLVAKGPGASHVVLGADLGEIWHGMWSRGARSDITVALRSTRQAPILARSIVTRACLDWHLNTLVGPAARLTGGLVARSVIQGAEDIHLTVSRYQSRVRVLTRHDVPAAAKNGAQTINEVFDAQFDPSDAAGSRALFGEFALEGHQVRWAVTRESQSVWAGDADAFRHPA